MGFIFQERLCIRNSELVILSKIPCSTDIPEIPVSAALSRYKLTPQLDTGPGCEWPSLGLCKSCTHGKRTTEDTQRTKRKQSTVHILFKAARANRCGSTARKTGFRHEASLTSHWLRISHETTGRLTERITLIASFRAAKQLANATHVYVLWTHPVANSPLAGQSPEPYHLPKSKKYVSTARLSQPNPSYKPLAWLPYVSQFEHPKPKRAVYAGILKEQGAMISCQWNTLKKV